MQQARASLEWPHWKGAIDVEMKDIIDNEVWKQQLRPADTLVETKMRKTGQYGEVEKYKCRLVAQRVRQVIAVHF